MIQKYRITGISILLGALLIVGGSELKAQDVQSSTMKFGRLLRLV
jgi:hypothetical protein